MTSTYQNYLSFIRVSQLSPTLSETLAASSVIGTVHSLASWIIPAKDQLS